MISDRIITSDAISRTERNRPPERDPATEAWEKAMEADYHALLELLRQKKIQLGSGFATSRDTENELNRAVKTKLLFLTTNAVGLKPGPISATIAAMKGLGLPIGGGQASPAERAQFFADLHQKQADLAAIAYCYQAKLKAEPAQAEGTDFSDPRELYPKLFSNRTEAALWYQALLNNRVGLAALGSALKVIDLLKIKAGPQLPPDLVWLAATLRLGLKGDAPYKIKDTREIEIG